MIKDKNEESYERISEKVNEEEVSVDNLSFFEAFYVQKFLDNIEIAKKAFGVTNESSQLFENISKLKKSIIFNKNNFRAIKYNRKVVGFIQLFFENHEEVKIGIVIGEKRYWGRNIGSIALKKLIKDLFETNGNLKRVLLDTAVFNISAKRCFEKVGFKVYKEENGKVFMYLDRAIFENNGG
ncbi:MAG: GNAT family N-acetyltransferase [bacterium]